MPDMGWFRLRKLGWPDWVEFAVLLFPLCLIFVPTFFVYAKWTVATSSDPKYCVFNEGDILRVSMLWGFAAVMVSFFFDLMRVHKSLACWLLFGQFVAVAVLLWWLSLFPEAYLATKAVLFLFMIGATPGMWRCWRALRAPRAERGEP